MAFQALRGTNDILPDEAARWRHLERTARRFAALYGYQEIRTPLIEDVGLFVRSVGETSDIVQKEMFRFEDRGGHEIVLRPEGTASIVRAYLEHHLDKTHGLAKLFYLGPMFRAERPQAGRLRQFHQYGVEAIGSSSPWMDVEVILLCLQILQECGVPPTALSVWMASLGCREDQRRSAEALRARLTSQRPQLCKDCQARFEKNVFRTLDCKTATCRQLAWHGGSPFGLCTACQQHFDAVRGGLRKAKVAFDDTTVFARGLDYYTRTVFEVRAQGLGAQDTIAAGGRYDHLVEEFGGPAVGAVGFAAGIERVLLATQAVAPLVSSATARHGCYVAVTQPALVPEAFRFVQQLRQQGFSTLIDYDGKSLKAQLREADKAGCQFVAIMGEAEVKAGTITVKDLEQGSQEVLPAEKFIERVSEQTKRTCH